MSPKLNAFLGELKAASMLPAFIETSAWHDWHLVSCFDEKPDEKISEVVYMGIDRDPEIAVFKSLTEYCERTISRASSDPITKLTDRSDGFAAFPVQNANSKNAQLEARENALNEAIERYMWSTWWDNREIKYVIKDALDSELKDDFQILMREFNLISVREIQIEEDQGEYGLSIFLAQTKRNGYLTGGACSKVSERMRRFVPAFGELLRHLIAYANMSKAKNIKSTFYQNRLMGFGSGQWKDIVNSRLQADGIRKIKLPALRVDQELVHSKDHLVKIHRCLFHDQPLFMGGNLERLCI